MPRDIDGIVDDIDTLVDEQLATEPTGYDYNIGQDTCPHCQRHWHGMPLTERVADMYAYGDYDSRYNYAADTGPIACPGSEFIGPMPPGHNYGGGAFDGWQDIGYIGSDDGGESGWVLRYPPLLRTRSMDWCRWWKISIGPNTDAELEINRELINHPRGSRIDQMIGSETVTLHIGLQSQSFPMNAFTYQVWSENDNGPWHRADLYVFSESPPMVGDGWVDVTYSGDTRNPIDADQEQSHPGCGD